MKPLSGTLFLAFAAVLAAASGCSRTYDGSIVPTYELATEKVAGIPFLTLKETPLDPPDMRGLNVPPPEGVSSESFDTSNPPDGGSVVPAPRRSSPPRRAARRPVAAQQAEAKALQCRDEAPGAQPVRIVCE